MKAWTLFTKLLPYLIVAYLILNWAPIAWRNYNEQGKLSPQFSVQLLEGTTLNSAEVEGPMVVVFWATWCGPCTLELMRIQRLVRNGEIPRDSVLAISQEKDLELIRATVKERGYSFPIGWDSTGELFHRFAINVTPTLVVLDSEKTIAWTTSGLSPTLELRLRSHLKVPHKRN